MQVLQSQIIVEGKCWSGNCANRRYVGVAAGQSIGQSIQLPRTVFDREIITKELSHPRVLWNHCEALIEDVVETPMICTDCEGTTP